jgi:hypothetical protein
MGDYFDSLSKAANSALTAYVRPSSPSKKTRDDLFTKDTLPVTSTPLISSDLLIDYSTPLAPPIELKNDLSIINTNGQYGKNQAFFASISPTHKAPIDLLSGNNDRIAPAFPINTPVNENGAAQKLAKIGEKYANGDIFSILNPQHKSDLSSLENSTPGLMADKKLDNNDIDKDAEIERLKRFEYRFIGFFT